MRICPACRLTYQEGEARCLVDGTPLTEADDHRLGMVLGGRYVLEEVLGEGGMATVYRARHNLVNKACAVKILHPALATDPTLRERLRREARSAAAISHPNVVEIYDFGETPEGEPYLVMELLQGGALREYLGEPLPLEQVVDIGIQIAAGLARAHDIGVVHRDLKPENVFIVEGSHGAVAKVVDFGLARANEDTRLTASGSIVGTPPYMAPERFKEPDVTPAADVYALGVVLFEMAAGRLPFQSNNMAGYVMAHLEDAPPTPSSIVSSIPPELDQLIAELLAKRPTDRPVDAHQVVERLLAIKPRRSKARLRVASKGEAPKVLVTIDRWENRLKAYDAVITEAYPQGPPSDLGERLAELRVALGHLRALRASAMESQRELERLEADTASSRERLGHAIHVLGVELSAVRAESRTVQKAAADAEVRIGRCAAEWQAADAQLAQLRRAERNPGAAELGAGRRALEALESWHDATRILDESQAALRQAEEKERDLEFQVDALRAQLTRVEKDLDTHASESRARLGSSGTERRKEEMRILHVAAKLQEAFSKHPELRELLERSEKM